MGINQVAGISGSFIGLILGGVLAAVDWRLVFLVSVPIGIGGTIWSYLSLRETGIRTKAKIDWLGNVTFAVGLIALLAGITYGIQPYGGHTMGWTSPLVLTGLIGGAALLAAFCFIETAGRSSPMFDLQLLRIRAVRRRQRGHPARVDRPRRPAVHAHHLAAGHLAGAARLQLRGHPALVGHLPAAADVRLRRVRPGLGVAVGQARRPRLRLRRAAAVGAGVRPAAAGADQLPLSGLRGAHLPGRRRHGPVLRAQRGGHHEQRPGAPARCRLRHARHLPELRLRAVDRRVLLADDRGTGLAPCPPP